MPKQFNLYANIVTDADKAPALRKAAKAIADKLLKSGAWCDGARVRVDDIEGDERVRVLVEVSGPGLDDIADGRAQLIALAEKAKQAGAEVHTLGCASSMTDENIFDERPDLQHRPSGETAPQPISVQLADALATASALAEQLATTQADLAKAVDERNTATELLRRASESADARQASLVAQYSREYAALQVERDGGIAREKQLRDHIAELESQLPLSEAAIELERTQE